LGTVLTIFAGIAGLYLLVCLTSLTLLGKVSLEPIDIRGDESDWRVKACTTIEEWTQRNGFTFVGYYCAKIGFQGIFPAVWRRTDKPTFLCHCVYWQSNRGARCVPEFVTGFAQDISLVTANSRDAQMLPQKEGSYKQTFSDECLDDLWDRHIVGEDYLIDQGGAQLVQIEGSFEDHFLKGVREERRYVRSIPLWFLRGPYWYFVRRNKWHGKSIMVQHERGMIKLPNELSKLLRFNL